MSGRSHWSSVLQGVPSPCIATAACVTSGVYDVAVPVVTQIMASGDGAAGTDTVSSWLELTILRPHARSVHGHHIQYLNYCCLPTLINLHPHLF